MPKRQPIPWSVSEPYKGLGFRNIQSQTKESEYKIAEYLINKEAKL